MKKNSRTFQAILDYEKHGLTDGRGALLATEGLLSPTKMREQEFLGLYANVVNQAKALLIEANKTCGDDWPAGQNWEDLVPTSKSVFMFRARDYMLIDHDAFLSIVRNWPYSDEGKATMDALFGK